MSRDLERRLTKLELLRVRDGEFRHLSDAELEARIAELDRMLEAEYGDDWRERYREHLQQAAPHLVATWDERFQSGQPV